MNTDYLTFIFTEEYRPTFAKPDTWSKTVMFIDGHYVHRFEILQAFGRKSSGSVIMSSITGPGSADSEPL